MIRRSDEKLIFVNEHAFDGEGSITVHHILNNPEEMHNKGRIFAHTTLQPRCSIGFHIHEGESETYYIIRGKAEFNDNGIIQTVSTGDVTFTPAGQGHGIKNIGDEPLEIIALILYE
jgi:mannose-6-phosphate isomerase-like protein (cupin superfamily)